MKVQKNKRQIIRKPELLDRIGLSDTTIWRMEKVGKFPKRLQLGGNSVGWFDDEIDDWQNAKAAERQSQQGDTVPVR
jgi:prophage regulatory protein